MIERSLHAMRQQRFHIATQRQDRPWQSGATQQPPISRRTALAALLRTAFSLVPLATLGVPAALCLGGCAARDEQVQRIGKLVGLKIEHGAVRSDGEGPGSVGVFEVGFSGDQVNEVEEQITASALWHAFPLAEALAAALYGPTGTTALPSLGDAQDGFTHIEQGWWYFENRATDSSGAAIDGESTNQASTEGIPATPEDAAITQAFADATTAGLHLTIGLYDSQRRALFVYTLDSDH